MSGLLIMNAGLYIKAPAIALQQLQVAYEGEPLKKNEKQASKSHQCFLPRVLVRSLVNQFID